ncbi:MAG: SDR family NAD(P)-dependent oxidoreductase [Planctomycetota bacterium]|jgi:pteridine reductase
MARTALVTGAARRIGRAIALELAAHGWDVVLHCHASTDAAEAVRGECEALGVRAAVVPGDLSVAEDLADLWDRCADALDPIDLLVNNAAVYPRTPLADVTLEDWKLALRVNLVAPAELARRAGLTMRSRGNGGCIVNITDWATARPQPNFLPYHAAKGALDTVTLALAKELAPEVRVNAVAPGPILPPEGVPDGHLEQVLASTPLGRLGDPSDIAAAVRYFSEAPYTTGCILPVDGGRTIG